MHTIFAPKASFEPSSEPESQPEPDPLLSQSNAPPSETPIPAFQFAEQVTFWLDLPSSSESNDTEDETQQQALLSHVQPLKQKKLDVSYHDQRKAACAEKVNKLKYAHTDIEKLLASAKTKWVSGRNGLQIR